MRLSVEKVALGAALLAASMVSGSSAFAKAPSADSATATATAGTSPSAKKPKKHKKAKKPTAADATSASEQGAKGSTSAAPVAVTSATVKAKSADDATTTPSADDDTPKKKREIHEEKVEAKAEEKAERKEEKAEGKEEDELAHPLFLGIDMVIGSARTATATNLVPPGTTAGPNGTTATGTSRVTNYSFILNGGILLTPGFGIGARIPISGGSLYTDPDRATGAVGNLELGAGGEVNLAQHVDLELGLGVSLPTAQGNQIPDNPNNVPVTQGSVNQPGYDRFSVQRAAEASRGYEENALFEPAHLGINPEIKLRFSEHESWHIDPWVKLENLIATSSNYSFIDELVFGANLGVYATKNFEPAVRVWVNAPLKGADFTTVGVVEPEFRFHFKQVTPVLGAILPFAGPISNPYAFGVRASVGVRF